MQLHHLKPAHKLKKRRRIGRGGKRGGYSGRGIKGQKSRAGAKIRPAIRDLIMKLPKRRGRAKHAFKSLFVKPSVLNLGELERRFAEGSVISPQTLFERGIISKKSGILPEIKILAEGKFGKKMVFAGVLLSKPARDKIKKAGGNIK